MGTNYKDDVDDDGDDDGYGSDTSSASRLDDWVLNRG